MASYAMMKVVAVAEALPLDDKIELFYLDLVYVTDSVKAGLPLSQVYSRLQKTAQDRRWTRQDLAREAPAIPLRHAE